MGIFMSRQIISLHYYNDSSLYYGLIISGQKQFFSQIHLAVD